MFFQTFFCFSCVLVFVISRLSATLSWTRTENLRCEHSGVYFRSMEVGLTDNAGDRRGVNREETREMGLSSGVCAICC